MGLRQKLPRSPLFPPRAIAGRRLAFLATSAEDELPLRAELFSREQMAQHGKVVAAGHRLSAGRRPDRLLARLADNEHLLMAVRALLTEAVEGDRRITPAGEWLLDNFYLIEEQIRTARRHLPAGYSRELPRLANGPSAALPRVYDIALETVSHGDGRLDTDALGGFVAAYQTVTPLTIGELWAIPIMLRLALIENLRRVATRIGADRENRNRADFWADQMTAIAEKDPKSLILLIADMARSDPPMVSSFVAEFARRLQGKSPALALPLTWIEQRLAEDGLTIEHLVQSENQRQAADQVSISNSISSLRFLGAADWRAFVEARSGVERLLREDPAGVYPRMDFATRDQYRHTIETTALRCRRPEEEVARHVLGMAREAAAVPGAEPTTTHVGFYLAGKGLAQLEQVVGARFSMADTVRRMCLRRPLVFYLGSIAMLTALLSAYLVARLRETGAEPQWIGALAILCLFAASQVAITLVNGVVPWLVTPRTLPKMEFLDGVPAGGRTLVVVPALITSADTVERLVEALEVRFLGNRDDRIGFALLTDFADAPEERRPEDDDLVRLAEQRIVELNRKYASGTPGVGAARPSPGSFFLFHRPRRWNESERTWMGYERKRGKLAELNALLRGAPPDRFSRVVGDTSQLTQVKYVITLDADTQLPRDAARLLIGAMMHPLNHARYDEREQRVTEGYGVLQPRVAVSLPGATRSWYARLWSSDAGVDPYSRAASDVYQDLFSEGSFIGKGIYDVDAFVRAVGSQFPENRILSHDLIEGCYSRAGLLSDVQVYEEHPSRYDEDVRRRIRWIRGDWQLWRWLLPGVPGPAGRRRNPLRLLSRWKLFDNLRRSLVPAAFVSLFLAGWAVPDAAWFWTLAGVTGLVLPALVATLPNVMRKSVDVRLVAHLIDNVRMAGRQAMQALLTLACLPYEAYYSVSAVVRTMIRLLVLRRRLLEWTPSGHVAHPDGQTAAWMAMWFAPALAIAAGACLWLVRPASLPAAAPVLVLWFASPGITWHLSRPLARRPARLTRDQLRFLGSVARRTWGFFDTYVGPDDHWLPPDNFQESPAPAVAHRTSPTNMGLALLANLSACDFGYISPGRLVDRTARAFQAMSVMERHRGHFYNWYDTQTLAPLDPRYISSVDSGNLAGHLLTLRPGLLALVGEPILSPRAFHGLRATFDLAAVAHRGQSSAALSRLQRSLDAACDAAPATVADARDVLQRLETESRALAADLSLANDATARGWATALAEQCLDVMGDLLALVPWASRFAAAATHPRSPQLAGVPTLGDLAALDDEWASPARARIETIGRLATQAAHFAEMEWDFLFDPTRHLLSIGYSVSERRRDSSFYDLLASEARLGTFVAIAQGHLPQESWFALGRLLTVAAGEPVLLSWSGSMFEYLMPLVVMPTYEGTLLDQTCRAAVKRQIEYATDRGVPWGISESGFNLLDARATYQYRAFGVPGLGLKRGLSDDLVIAPYASALALMVVPEDACANLQRLAADGFEGQLGFYEAGDYTPTRVPRGLSHVLVRSYMAHHQGMTLLSLAHLLEGRRMQGRFAADPAFQATALLLQERIPRASAAYLPPTPASEAQARAETEVPVRVLTSPDTPAPEVQLLSNGRYHVMVTASGGGYSRWKDLAITRWREDATCDSWGTFCYIRDVADGTFWSATHQPAGQAADRFEAVFSEGRAEFRSRTRQVESYTEVAVSPEDDVELRRLRVTNGGRVRRTIEVTTYAEVALAPPTADALHPAFSNLFVETEVLTELRAILCTRRPRSSSDVVPWMFHLMVAHGRGADRELSFETDRLRFLGRDRTTADPRAMDEAGPLSGSEGSVLDPIVAIRGRFVLDPDESITIDVVSGVTDTREGCLGLAAKYQDRRLANRVFALAATHAQVVLRQLNASEADAQLYCRLAGAIIYANPTLRADQSVLTANRRGQSGLWGYSVSGDLPIVLLQIADAANVDLVRRLVQAHAYWRLKGLAVDLVIWNEDRAGYRQQLQEQILGLIAAGVEMKTPDRPGAIFVRPAEQISTEDRILFQAVARAIITDGRGTLEGQIVGRSIDRLPPSFAPSRTARAMTTPSPGVAPRADLVFFNGLGGFTPDGREYIITTGATAKTPAPWVNVLANARFGSVVSESGSAYTWAENAHEFRLTPWNNDAVTDASGEALFIRDDETGRFWSPTPLPAQSGALYTTRHGFGYSVFEHTTDGIASELWVYVDVTEPVKWSVLKIRNLSGRPRRLSVTGYAEWVLGDLRSKAAPHVLTSIDPETGALLAGNTYNAEFAARVAFFHVDDARQRSVSGDRAEFIGRHGTLRYPAALTRATLSNRVGGGLDPCGAIQVPFELDAGQDRAVVFRLGAGRDADEALAVLRRIRGGDAARAALDAVWHYWSHTLGAIHVETPDPALDVLANGWLLYQTLACRLWGRSGFYQSGGAFGFRDQLQDSMALVHAEAPLVREHLLLCASRQFPEGDVQHWWHPPVGRGVRTHCSDDYLWLPMAVCRYVRATADTGVLDEMTPFLLGRAVNPDEDSYYDLPGRSPDSVSLYDHCVRAITRALRFGAHGLPLMGSGDWNDGMNLVGAEGRGESVWLGFFLYAVLEPFAEIARRHGDIPFADRCLVEAQALRERLEDSAWDGAWYRRAYFDDGAPLGSSQNTECQIDSIAQSWSVLSRAADPRRARAAMDAVDSRLVRRDDGLVRLLDPPFDLAPLDPGYIKGYVPGVRENGGQYTHAAIWTAMAFAELGDARRAWEVWRLIDPLGHGASSVAIERYKVEPYVVAADVYAVAPHVGRGGWTWYTGSAAWMYRLLIESLLGVSLEGNHLRIAPRFSPDWAEFKVHYRYRETVYHLTVHRLPSDSGAERLCLDGRDQTETTLVLADDRQDHTVDVWRRAVT